MHTCTLVVSRHTFLMNPHFLGLRFSQNLSHKCKEDRPYYAKQYQDIVIQYNECFNFITGEASAEFKDTTVAVPEGAPPITPYTKAEIRNGYNIPQ